MSYEEQKMQELMEGANLKQAQEWERKDFLDKVSIEALKISLSSSVITEDLINDKDYHDAIAVFCYSVARSMWDARESESYQSKSIEQVDLSPVFQDFFKGDRR